MSTFTLKKVSVLLREVRLQDGMLAGTLQGDWTTGFTARTATGGWLGYWPPTYIESRELAIEAIVAVATVADVLGGEVIEVRSVLAPARALKAYQDTAA